jgi:hypothetical protein
LSATPFECDAVALGGVGARNYGVRAGLVAGSLVEVLGACSEVVGTVAGRVGAVAGASRSFDGMVEVPPRVDGGNVPGVVTGGVVTGGVVTGGAMALAGGPTGWITPACGAGGVVGRPPA